MGFNLWVDVIVVAGAGVAAVMETSAVVGAEAEVASGATASSGGGEEVDSGAGVAVRVASSVEEAVVHEVRVATVRRGVRATRPGEAANEASRERKRDDA